MFKKKIWMQSSANFFFLLFLVCNLQYHVNSAHRMELLHIVSTLQTLALLLRVLTPRPHEQGGINLKCALIHNVLGLISIFQSKAPVLYFLYSVTQKEVGGGGEGRGRG